MKRTTLLLTEELLINARYLAARQGRTMTELVQDALKDYTQAHWLPLDLEFAGMGNSGDPTLAARDEEILAAELDANEGWSPKPPGEAPPNRPSNRTED